MMKLLISGFRFFLFSLLIACSSGTQKSRIISKDTSPSDIHYIIVSGIAQHSMDLLKEKAKVFFIHLNRTNPAICNNSEATKTILKNGFKVTWEGMRLKL